MIWIAAQLLVKLVGRNAHLVQVAAITELNATGNHMNVESFHVGIGNVSR